ncbi:hypothetical protein CYY_007202 [Polysphondylium violaceum]|uniref:Uncharacterized protein n=1 Tax=Polysphondylium violaceum TaxID=133409 RepID=A0A8J4PXW9_9MYCE|nr:hypothetical protein CYY_007202 [Polysphondylium violaceum]
MDEFENLDSYIEKTYVVEGLDQEKKKEQDQRILNETLKRLEGNTSIEITNISSSTTTTTTTIPDVNNNNNKEDEDDEEYIKQKQKEIDSIKPHYSSEDEMVKFKIEECKRFIEQLEKSNIELALAYQDDPDPIYYDSISENIAVIEKRKYQLLKLEELLLKAEGGLYL